MSLTKEQEFSMFDNAVKAIVQANALMLSITFADLLKLVSYDDPIRICVAECYASIDYETLLTTAFEKKDNRFAVNLPKGNKAVVGFVTKLIYEFHLGTQSFDKLMISLYGSSGTEALRLFSEQVLNPYREAFRQVFLYDVKDDEVDVDDPVKEINPAIFNELYVIASQMRSEIDSDNKLSEDDRKNLIELVDGLCYSLELGENKLVRSAWLGMSIALDSFKLCSISLGRLETLLKRYMVI